MAKKKTKSTPPQKISSDEYDKLTNSGYNFAAREMQSQQGKIVRATKTFNRFYGPQLGNPNKGMAVPKPTRPLNSNIKLDPKQPRKPKPKANTDSLKNMAKKKK